MAQKAFKYKPKSLNVQRNSFSAKIVNRYEQLNITAFV
jgi:hypothetical protein